MFDARVAELETLARDQGLDFFPVSFEVVPQDIMTEVAAYGLPTRARHWSYGKVYQHQHLYGTMGLSKIYEIVLNSDPGLAFLLDSNPEIANLLVAAQPGDCQSVGRCPCLWTCRLLQKQSVLCGHQSPHGQRCRGACATY